MNDASCTGKASAAELKDLLHSFEEQFLPWIESSDAPNYKTLDHYTGKDLEQILDLQLPEQPCGKDRMSEILAKTLKYSANTWSPGFMDKLFASTNPIGVISELLLGVLNTGNHVFHVSPVTSLMEKATASAMAQLFGYHGEHVGGLTMPGGSQSNSLSMVTARSTLYPETKDSGCGLRRFAIFTSKHGHYSIEKGAIMLGMGRESVIPVDIDDTGRMKPDHLEECILKAQKDGMTPLYVNATAGTTVLGSFDPFTEIGTICGKYKLWFHIDGSWGGGVAFSSKYKHLLRGSHLAHSITINPHKMLGTPLQCSFLLVPDVRVFQKANSLKAGYLFHGEDEFDLGDSTMGCGRRPDAVKMFLGWNWYGRIGYEQRVEHAYEMAGLFASKLASNPQFTLVSSNPPPCLQVCFYFHPDGSQSKKDSAVNTSTTRKIATALDHQGKFLVDYAPGPHGEFFRAVFNSPNQSEASVDELIKSFQGFGKSGEHLTT